MRIIKFRAWDKEYKQLNFNGLEILNYIKLPKIVPRNNNFIIMQWTGLQDSSGVDIYESDIIKVLDGELIYIVNWSNEDVSYVFIDKDGDKIEYHNS